MGDSASITKEYSNGEVTIVWKPDVCIHAANCAKGLPSVFDSKARPWINAKGATTQEIVDQVAKCPSGALGTYMNAEGKEAPKAETSHEQIVEVIPNGPLRLHGPVTVKSESGTEMRENKFTSFCRCGASSNKPYCDGTHKKIEWEG